MEHNTFEKLKKGVIMKALIIVDMQNDFIDGSLANPTAQAIVDDIAEFINDSTFDTIICTQDTHQDNYLDTQEGKNLPIKHCIEGEPGWMINGKISSTALLKGFHSVTKDSFGDIKKIKNLLDGFIKFNKQELESIYVCGTCTDICVISVALNLKAAYPETKMYCLANLCAGLTPEKHEAALEVMQSCQIEVIR